MYIKLKARASNLRNELVTITRELIGPLQFKDELKEANPETRVAKVKEQASYLLDRCKYIYEVSDEREDRCSLANHVLQNPNFTDVGVYASKFLVEVMTDALFMPRTAIGRTSPHLFQKSGMSISSIALVYTLVWVSFICYHTLLMWNTFRFTTE